MNNYSNFHITIVIPYFNAANQIESVIKKIPDFINDVVIVNDCSPDKFSEVEIKAIINSSTKLHFLKTEINLGVGGATKVGFIKATELNSDFIIKIDADDQMDLFYIPELLDNLVEDKADMAKGNRFKDFKALSKMPIFRRVGNLILSFLIKMATGYWNNFDPTNGFFAIKSNLLRTLDFDKISNRYYFETSLLAELYYHKAVIKDVPMPAIYNNEKSNMQVWKMPFVFGPKLLNTFFKRIIKTYFLYDFNLGSVYLIFGIPLFLFGLIFGIYTWVDYSSQDILTPTGTIMIITLSLILGFQLILQAIQYDVINTPKSKD